MNTVRSGNYYRSKTLTLLREAGFDAEVVEYRTKRGCRDLWGADIIAKRRTGPIVFVQVKKVRADKSGKPMADTAEIGVGFSQYAPWPKSAALLGFLWTRYCSTPRVFTVQARIDDCRIVEVHIDHLQAVAKEAKDVV